MKNSDKLLIGIVAGIVLLVLTAFVIILTQPEPVYQPEDAPEGVAHNYLLALQNEDYQRAYGYLSPKLQSYPASVEEFTRNVRGYSWAFRSNVDTTLAIESAQVRDNWSVVKVRESRFRGGDLFDSGQSFSIFEMELRFEDGDWKIIDSDYYFAWCWRYSEGCR